MKKILLALCLVFLSITAYSQPQGLQGVIVEKFHVATVADNAADPTLPVGAITYRVFIDMQTGWRLKGIFGDVDAAQNVVIRTSAANGFWNRPLANGGGRFGHQINFASLGSSSLRYDSWLGMGAAAAPSAPNFYHGIPLSANPTGIITVTAPPTRVLEGEVPGDQSTILYPMMDGTSTVNNYTSADFGLFSTNPANWLEGPDSDNRLLIGQFTTTGDFTYQFNVSLNRTSDNRNELYVAENEATGQYLFPALRGFRGLPTPPVVSITSVLPAPNTYTEGAVVTMTANATDLGGSITRVEFFAGSTSIGVGTRVGVTDNYTLVWTSTPTTGPLTAVATDNEDTKQTSASVPLTVASAAGYTIPRQLVSCNTSDLFYIQVLTKNSVDNIIGFDLDMNYDKSRVRPTGEIRVNSDLINPAYISYATRIIPGTTTDAIRVSLFLNANAPAGTKFAGAVGRQVLSVEFAKTLAFNPTDSVVFSVPLVTESRISGVTTAFVENGTYRLFKEFSFTGYLKAWSDNSPIVYASGVNLITNITGNAAGHGAAVQPDAVEGKFVYDINNGLTINIDRYIDNATPVNSVITGYDAYLTQKVVLGDASFKPNVFQIMAMDVNMDKRVTAGDVSQILQRSTLIYGEFRTRVNYSEAGVSNGQPTLDWYFVDNRSLYGDPETGTHGYAAFKISTSFPENDGVGYSRFNTPSWPWNNLGIPVKNAATCPVIYDEEYQGIMLGDVDGSYKNIAPSPLLKKATIGTKSAEITANVLFDLSRTTVGDGFVTFPVLVSSETDINSLDFSMQFDESKLAFKEVVNHGANMQSAFHFNAADKTMRFSSFSMQKYAIGTPVVSVRFEMKNNNLTTNDLKSLVAYLNGAPVAVKTTDLKIRDNQEKIRIYPNPARNFTTVELTENADIKILDVNGKLIREENNVAAYDRHVISLSGLPQGIYFMKITMKIGSDVFVTTRKVVIKK